MMPPTRNPAPQVTALRTDDEAYEHCLQIRLVVFVEEQEVPYDEEVDGLDPSCLHFLARSDDQPLGTCRLRVTEDGITKAERVAVLREARGKGIGLALMEALETEARSRSTAEVLLSAQEQVIPFYERLGYVAYGPRYLDCSIWHRMMRKALA